MSVVQTVPVGTEPSKIALAVAHHDGQPDTHPTTAIPPTPSPQPPGFDEDRFLVSSAYSTPPHLLDLQTLTTPQALIARSLASLVPIRSDYATAPYDLSFNWSTVLSKLQELSNGINFHYPKSAYHIVVFRSQIPPTTSRLELSELDERSHAEANKSGGLLKYWFGTPDETGRNLATCLWRAQSDTKPAGRGEGHRAAAKATCALYTEWNIERLALIIEEGATGWRIEDWRDE